MSLHYVYLFRHRIATLEGFEPSRPVTDDLDLAGRCHTKLGHSVIYYIDILVAIVNEEVLYNILPYP